MDGKKNQQLSIRLTNNLRGWLNRRAKLRNQSLNAEIVSLLNIVMDNDLCSEVEVRRDRGLYLVKSRYTGEVFMTFQSKAVALSFAKNALASTGLDPAGVHDATEATEAA